MNFFKKSDIIIITCVLVISILFWLGYKLIFNDKPAKAEIYYKQEKIKEIDLNTEDELTFSVPGHEDVVFRLYEDGSISFLSSDCPDKICVKTGKLNTVGESAACLPNEIILKIIPADEYDKNDPDIVIGK